MKIKPEPKALRAAIKSAENWDFSVKCVSYYYKDKIERRPGVDTYFDEEYGGPAVAYWAVASVEHREELLGIHLEYDPVVEQWRGVDCTIRFLVILAGNDYTALIDDRDFSFLYLWRSHLLSTEDEDED